MSVKSVVVAVVRVLRHEPVAVYGVVVAALLAALAGVGVPADVISLIGGGFTLAGVPVVRGRVSPVDAVKAVVNGAEGKPVG